MKSGAKDHAKVKRLKRLLGIPIYAAVGVLETLYQFSINSADDGMIGRYTNEEIAAELEWAGDADQLIAALVDSRLVDEVDDGRLAIHDWLDHAPKFIKDRLRAREKRTCARLVSDKSHDDATCRTAERQIATLSDKSPLTQPNPTQPNPTQPNQGSGGFSKRDVPKQISLAELKDSMRLAAWYRSGNGSLAERARRKPLLEIMALAERALAKADDPVGMFVAAVTKGDWSKTTNGEEERARRKLLAMEEVARYGEKLPRGDGASNPDDDVGRRRAEAMKQLDAAAGS